MMVSMTDHAERLQDRKRLAVQKDIAETAERLFMERGYDATTMDDIATACGMSTRTAYRYYPTKDDILVSRFAGSADLLVAALRSRPHAEPAWVSLRAAFEGLTRHVDNRTDRASVQKLHQAIFSTPALLGRYLQRLHGAQHEMIEILRDRSDGTAGKTITDEVVLAATVGAAVACLIAAQETWSHQQHSLSLASVLDRAMDGVAPTAASIL
ncbi:TetR family transcriptional regulator [Actinoplanes sp. NPDC089786]|uniref:TetR/AcrR family transcriptional regulator n=1 Tax=Actinoplanes sp. NPDC089786 TaxID=3155185 RepID=UPI00343698D0